MLSYPERERERQKASGKPVDIFERRAPGPLCACVSAILDSRCSRPIGWWARVVRRLPNRGRRRTAQPSAGVSVGKCVS